MGLIEGYKASGDMFSMGTEQFSNGNILGGLYNYSLGLLSGIGNTITGGLANDWGNATYESISEKTDVVVDETTHFVETQQVAGKDRLNLFERIVSDVANSNASAYQLAEHGETGAANLISGIDFAGLVVDCTPIGAAGLIAKPIAKGVTKIGEFAGKTATKFITSAALKEAAKVGAKTGAASLAKEVAEEAVEQTAKAGIKAVAKEVVSETAEQTAKAGIKATTKAVVKETAEEVAEQTAKAGVKTGVKASMQRITNTVTKGVVKAGVATSLAQATGQHVVEFADDIEENGFGAAVAHQVVDQATNIAGDAAQAVNDLAECASDAWMKAHPGLAKFVNTCRAAVAATVETCAKCEPVSYVIGVASMAKYKVMSWFSGSRYAYEGKTLKQVADDIRKNAVESSTSWTDSYIKHVKAYDKDWGVDSNTRTILVNPSNTKSVDDASPSYA